MVHQYVVAISNLESEALLFYLCMLQSSSCSSSSLGFGIGKDAGIGFKKMSVFYVFTTFSILSS